MQGLNFYLGLHLQLWDLANAETFDLHISDQRFEEWFQDIFASTDCPLGFGFEIRK